MIFKNIFAKKLGEKIGVFCLKTKLNYAKFWSLHWFFRKKNFAENCLKSLKILIITSTPEKVQRQKFILQRSLF
jgi:hypothetical protein